MGQYFDELGMVMSKAHGLGLCCQGISLVSRTQDCGWFCQGFRTVDGGVKGSGLWMVVSRVQDCEMWMVVSRVQDCGWWCQGIRTVRDDVKNGNGGEKGSWLWMMVSRA